MISTLTAVAVLWVAAAPAASSAGGPGVAPAADDRKAKLDALLAEQWEFHLKSRPEVATILGDKRYDDKLTDYSQAQIDRELDAEAKFLARFEAIDTTGLDEQSVLNKTLMVRDLHEELDAAKFKDWEMPINQMSGVQIDLPQLVAQLPFDTVKDYENYIARLGQIPRVFNENVIQMKKGVADGLVPPKLLLDIVATQIQELAVLAPEKSPFAQPLEKLPKTFSDKDAARLKHAVLEAIRTQVNPAYVKLAAFVHDEYAPKGRAQPGEWSLPDGDARYAMDVKRSTTTEMTPVEIHQLGLAQVAAIEAQMLVVAKKLGYADVKALNAAIAKNPKLHATSREQILNEYRGYTTAMWAKLPTLFGRLPKAQLEIRPIEEFNEKTAATHYDQGTPDGKRPGHVMVNTGDWTEQLLISNESTAAHEGVPGHHMQVSIAQELPQLPPFRQQAGYTAYVEGWALYSESLGKELGFYSNPYSDYGRLQDEMLRAIRLVVDTGVHHEKWSRQQIVDFFHAHSNLDEGTVQIETNRYIAWPAQALAYKVGQLTISRLRADAQKQLGGKFKLSAFHDEVLGAGALPLDVLETRMHQWVATSAR